MGLSLQVETGPVGLSRCEWVKAEVRPILREGREESQEVAKHRQAFSDRRGDVSQEAADLSAQTPHGTHGDKDRTRGTRQTPEPLTHIRSNSPGSP